MSRKPDSEQGQQRAPIGSDLWRQLQTFVSNVSRAASAFFARLGAMLGLRPAPAAGLLAPTLPSPSLLDLANETDAVLGLEVRKGCLGEVDAQVAVLRKRILEWETGYVGTVYEDEALDRIWVNLLRLGLFDELRHLADHRNFPFRFEVKAFLDYCAVEFAACKARGTTAP